MVSVDRTFQNILRRLFYEEKIPRKYEGTDRPGDDDFNKLIGLFRKLFEDEALDPSDEFMKEFEVEK